jgi:hypothetical protein
MDETTAVNGRRNESIIRERTLIARARIWAARTDGRAVNWSGGQVMVEIEKAESERAGGREE